ncbi:MAG TPA: nuclease-related domain-containing protein [Candidatus Deferrimicrobium sp.]|nr:nuclease-related domain-containing protein [Candidatus Deferrimicrobium sp.]
MSDRRRTSSLLDTQYDDLADALERVNLSRSFSRLAGIAFLCVVAAGGWHVYDGWFKKSAFLGWLGIGFLAVYVLILSVGLPRMLRPVVEKYNEQIATNRRERAAEDAVDAVLKALDESKYSVFRNVYRGYGDLDHVVVGPTGIFVIETKSNRGSVEMENGHLKIRGLDESKKDYERQASQESYQLKLALSERLQESRVFVEPVLAFPAAAKVPDGLELRRVNATVPVRVVHGKDLISVIAGHRTGMSITTLEACKKVVQDIVNEAAAADQKV